MQTGFYWGYWSIASGGQDSSPALDAEFLESSFNNVQVRYAKLQQIFRTAESSSIISNATYIRNKSIFQPPFIIELDGNTQSINGHEVQEKLEESIQAKGADNVVVLTLSNKQANRWNSGIRQRIHYREEVIESNESLLVIRNNYFWIAPTSRWDFLQMVKIFELNNLVKEEEIYGFEFATVLISFPNYPEEVYKEVMIMKDTLLLETATLGRDK